MAAMQPKATQPAQEPSLLGPLARGMIGAMIGAIAGVATVVVVGMFAFSAVYGLGGVIIGTVVGGLLGAGLRGFGDWPVRSLAGGVGGAVGGFFAVAAAEKSAPGSAEWAVRGGFLGVTFAVFVAAFASVAVGFIVALIRRVK